ncbi:MAG: DUF58 domain-containing protein, partial [Elusimicrobiota bacterium]
MDRLRWDILRLGSLFLRLAKKRLTPAGRTALAGLFLSALLGFDTNGSTAYQSFCFLAVLLLFSWL